MKEKGSIKIYNTSDFSELDYIETYLEKLSKHTEIEKKKCLRIPKLFYGNSIPNIRK